MWLSRYVNLFEVKNEFFVYNSLNRSILQIDKSLYEFFNKYKNTRQEIQLDCDEETISILKKKDIVISHEEDDIKLCLDITNYNRTRKDFRHITIAPTMDCCFNCYYCFEKNKKKQYIKEEAIKSIIEQIRVDKSLKHLHITWFGGEPLMAKESILKFSEELFKVYRGLYSSDIITNGWYLDKEAIEILKQAKISEIQVSLESSRYRHNQIKKKKNIDVYEKILENVELLIEQFPEINVIIRINFSKMEIENFISSYKYIKERFKTNRIHISPGFLISRNCQSINDFDNIYFSHDDKLKFFIDLWYKYRIPLGKVKYNDYSSECATRNPNSIVIDPVGGIYRCWEQIGDTSKRVGKMTSKGINREIAIEDEIKKELQLTDPIRDTDCMSCSFLPLCCQGCPLEKLKKKEGYCQNLYYNLIRCHLEYTLTQNKN